MLAPRNWRFNNEYGFEISAGALTVAINKAIKDGIYKPEIYNISIVWSYPQCDQIMSIIQASNMTRNYSVSAIFAPPCPGGAPIVAAFGAYKNIPIFSWAPLSSDFRNRVRYSTIINSAGTVNGLVLASANVLEYFNWTEVGFLHATESAEKREFIPLCTYFRDALQGSNF